jgi:hypothetical protein
MRTVTIAREKQLGGVAIMGGETDPSCVFAYHVRDNGRKKRRLKQRITKLKENVEAKMTLQDCFYITTHM